MGGLVKNTREVERQLAAVLHRHAEDAMNRTNTEVEYRKLQSVLTEEGVQTARRRWVGGGVAAAVVAAVVGVGVWSADPGGDRSSPPVAEAPDSTRTANLTAAEGFAFAFADHDAAAAAPYLAPGEEPWAGWRAGWKRDSAWGVEYLMKPCTKQYIISDSTVFDCPYAMHLLGSREVGEGPFRHNTLLVSVSHGKVLWADNTMPFETNGMGQHLDSVHDWLAQNHPKDKPFLFQEEQDVRPGEWPRWTQLWQQYTREYVAATNPAN
jgi:hypothetical protein